MKHELFSSAQTLRSWGRIPLEACLSALRVAELIPVQGVLPAKAQQRATKK
jgi:hypothetical protein